MFFSPVQKYKMYKYVQTISDIESSFVIESLHTEPYMFILYFCTITLIESITMNKTTGPSVIFITHDSNLNPLSNLSRCKLDPYKGTVRKSPLVNAITRGLTLHNRSR